VGAVAGSRWAFLRSLCSRTEQQAIDASILVQALPISWICVEKELPCLTFVAK
jgi:hypothetical protein